MTKKINKEQLVQLLPENFSEDTIQQVETLVESTVQERVSSVEKQLASRLNSFISENINHLKNIAITELENDNETLRAAKLFESVKAIVREEMVDDDVNEILESKDNEIQELKETIVALKEHIDTLESKNTALTESLESVSYQEIEEEEEDEDLNGSARIVTESEEFDVPSEETDEEEESDNPILSESILKLLRSEPTFSEYTQGEN
jgi:hypothetical protein